MDVGLQEAGEKVAGRCTIFECLLSPLQKVEISELVFGAMLFSQ